jgi:hypothetical protein
MTFSKKYSCTYASMSFSSIPAQSGVTSTVVAQAATAWRRACSPCTGRRRPTLLEGGGVQEGGGLDRRGAEVTDCVEVIGGGRRVALRVGGGDVVAERAVEVDFFSWIATMTFAAIGTGRGGRAA